MFKRSLLLTGLLAVVAISQASASVVVYNDLASFTAAAGALTTETFTGGTFNTVLTAVSDNGSVSPAENWADLLVPGGASTTFSFGGVDIFAFGGDFDLTPNGAGAGISLTLNLTGGGGAFLVPTEVPNSSAGNFFGVISTEGFSSVLLNGGTQGGVETYNLDNVAFSTQVSTPEPSTYMLLGSGLIGCFLARRKIKA